MSDVPDDEEFIFNIVWTGKVFPFLRYFVSSQLAHSGARFRFLANGCSPEQIPMMEAFREQHSDRVLEVLVVSEAMGAHGVALDTTMAQRDDGEFFCFIDPDILARGPFLRDFARHLVDGYAGVTSGKGVWVDDPTIPVGHVGVSGEYFYAPDGYLFERRWKAVRAAMEGARHRRAGDAELQRVLRRLCEMVHRPARRQRHHDHGGVPEGRPDDGGRARAVRRRRQAAPGDAVRRGVKRFLASPNFMGASFTTALDVENTEKALDGFSGASIGLIATGSMSHALVDHLKHGKLGNAQFLDATDLVDQIMVIKSDEEIAAIRATAHLQDRAMRAAFDAIKPGMRDIEVTAVAENYTRNAGAEYGLLMGASSPVGEPVMIQPRHLQNRVVREGDQFVLLVETTGPGGFFCEIGRTCVLGKATQSMQDEFAFAQEAQKFTVDMLKPGASCAEVWNGYNEFMKTPPPTKNALFRKAFLFNARNFTKTPRLPPPKHGAAVPGAE